MNPIGLSIPETGKALGGEGDPLSRATIYRMIGRGELEAFKLGSRTLITVASIEAMTAAAPRLLAA
jgi:excisionase family DNA binding protein